MPYDWAAGYTTGRETRSQSVTDSYRKVIDRTNSDVTTTTVVNVVRGARERNFHSNSPMITSPAGVMYRKARDYRRLVIDAPVSSAHRWRIRDDYPVRYKIREYWTEHKIRSLLISGWVSNPFDELISDNVSNRSVAEAMQRLNEGKVQLANDLIDAKKTLDMVCSAAMRGARALRAARRGDFRGAWNHLAIGPKNAANNWLEFTYGWKPFADSLFSAQELLLNKTCKSWFIRSARQCEESITQTFHNNWAGYLEAKGSVTWTKSVKTVILGNPRFQTAVTMRQWGLENPLSIIWEAVPYSFVVDWFLPIGNVIAGYSASAGLDFLTASSTVKVKAQLSGSWRASSISVGTREWSGFTESMEITRRHSHSSWPWPMIYLKNPFSTSHATSALALLSQVRR